MTWDDKHESEVEAFVRSQTPNEIDGLSVVENLNSPLEMMRERIATILADELPFSRAT